MSRPVVLARNEAAAQKEAGLGAVMDDFHKAKTKMQRELDEVVKVTGSRLIATVPAGVSVLGMAAYGGSAVVATSQGVYAIDGDKLVPIEFVSADGGADGP